MTKVAVVTGSNKGIGFGIVKGLLRKFNGVVYLTSRDVARGMEAVAKLKELGLKPKYHQLDVSNRESMIKFRDHIKENHGGIDILVNNAAVAINSSAYNSYEECKYVLDVNYYSILCIQDLLYPLVRDDGRILNISSNCGHLSNIKNQYWIGRLSKQDLTVNDVNEFVSWFLDGVNKGTFNYDEIADDGKFASYRVSKVALCAITIIQQKLLASKNICVNSVHPGYVQTDMTLNRGFYDIDKAAETPIYLVLEAPDTLKGAYVWHDCKVVDWFDYNGDYYFKASDLNF